MRKVSVVILSLIFMFQLFNKSWILLSFKMNQTEIAQTLCVQKEVKENSCQGKCQLHKTLKEAEQKEAPQAPNHSNNKVEITFLYTLLPEEKLTFLNPTEEKSFYTEESGIYAHTYINSIFRPPQVSFI